MSIGMWEEIGVGEKFSSKKGKIVKEVGSVRYNKNKSVENKQTDNRDSRSYFQIIKFEIFAKGVINIKLWVLVWKTYK